MMQSTDSGGCQQTGLQYSWSQGAGGFMPQYPHCTTNTTYLPTSHNEDEDVFAAPVGEDYEVPGPDPDFTATFQSVFGGTDPNGTWKLYVQDFNPGGSGSTQGWGMQFVGDPRCSDGEDNDGDGLIDNGADPGCANAGDASETSAALVCDNDVDDDGDGLKDFRTSGGDPGCASATDDFERNPNGSDCDDGNDDDGDGLKDFATSVATPAAPR